MAVDVVESLPSEHFNLHCIFHQGLRAFGRVIEPSNVLSSPPRNVSGFLSFDSRVLSNGINSLFVHAPTRFSVEGTMHMHGSGPFLAARHFNFFNFSSKGFRG